MELESAGAARDQALSFFCTGVLAPDVDPDERNEYVGVAPGRLQHLVVRNSAGPSRARAAGVDTPDGAGDLALPIEVGRLVGRLATRATALGHARERVVAQWPIAVAQRRVAREASVDVDVDGDQAVEVDRRRHQR